MKKIMIATVALFAAASAASAFERPTLLSYGEYTVEAQDVELGVGTEFILDGGLTITPWVVATDTGADSLTFDHAAINVAYGVNENVDLYGKVETDSDLNYSETTIGFKLQY